MGGFLKNIFKVAAPIAGGFLGGPLGAMAGAGLGGTFGGRTPNPSDSAMSYLNQIPGMAEKRYAPYKGTLEEMGTNPTSWYDKLMQHYQPSQQYQRTQKELTGGLANSAAAGGYSGTPQDERQRAELINELLQSDMGDFFKHIFGIQESGLQHGLGMAGDMSNILGSNLGQQAGYGYTGQSGQNLANSAKKQQIAALLQSIFMPNQSGNQSSNPFSMFSY